MRVLIVRLPLALIALAVALPAHAKVGDATWAQCAWEKAPLAAENWLNMSLPSWNTDTQEKNAALGFLLAAKCISEPANELKPNRDFNWKQMASSLKSARKPASDLQGDESSVVKLCRNFIEADATKSLYRIDIVRESTDGAKLLVFQQHFAEYEGKSLKLPQDIRAMPTDKDGKLSSDCTTIANDGSLTDA